MAFIYFNYIKGLTWNVSADDLFYVLEPLFGTHFRYISGHNVMKSSHVESRAQVDALLNTTWYMIFPLST